MRMNLKARLFCSLLTGLIICAKVWGMPAKGIPFTVINSDGTKLTLVLRGDEAFHFHTTLDGTPAIQDEHGDWQLKPELADSMLTKWKERSYRRNAKRLDRNMKRTARKAFGSPSNYVGEKTGIVLLVDFPNLSMKSTHTRNTFERMFNEKGYHDNYHYGSVHDYFHDQSYGQLNITFDVYGPITASKDYTYYGANDKEGYDKYTATLAAEVCKLADEQFDIDWSNYDWDNDGEVDQIYIIYAGYGENMGAPANAIWPHEWELSAAKRESRDGDGAITLGGCKIDTYAMSSELHGSTGSTINGIGTACHEFSHCLGLPDFYNIEYNGGFGMNYWDVMDSGSYNGQYVQSEQPAGFTAYERWFAGWLTPIELSAPCTIANMPALQDEPVAYIIYNEGNRNEYFLIENRQSNGWFQYVGPSAAQCHGLLITHVDYDKNCWRNNAVNADKDHQRMTIIPAGNNYGRSVGKVGEMQYRVTASEYLSQLFPGNQSVTVLDNESHKNHGGSLFNANTDGSFAMNKPITDITEQDGLVSFKFMGGDLSAISDIAYSHEEKALYYTLGGVAIPHPTAPGIYLVKQGGQTRKMMLR